ncbi:hypothetical protein MRX96_022723 [Rhipicephalus microplus]
MSSTKSKICLATFTAICGVVLLVGVLGHIYFPTIMRGKVAEQLQLKNGSETLEKWSNVKVPIYMSFHLFNITNPDEFAAGKKAELKQAGPYVYREYRKKEIQGFDNETNTVQYFDRKTFVFEPSLSAGTEDDVVNIINVPVAAIAALTRKKVPRTFARCSSKATRLDLCGTLSGWPRPSCPNWRTPSKTTRSDSSSGGTTAMTACTPCTPGEDSPTKFAKLEQWNNQKSLSYWAGPTCNMINGTDGGQFAPFLSKDTTLYVFSTDLCRSMYFRYEKETMVHGIRAWRFTIPASLFESADIREENRCFCLTTPVCPKSGVTHVAACRKGAPIVLSSPHFYHGDEEFVNAVRGLKPVKEMHETFLDIHPLTGLVMRASKRLQINVDLKGNERLTLLKNVQDTIFPVVWIEERAELAPSMAEEFKQKVEFPMKVGNAATASGLILGGIGSCICAIMVFIFYMQGKSRTAGISSEYTNGLKKVPHT